MIEPWSIQNLLRDMADRGEQPAVIALRGDALEHWSCARVADLAERLAAGLIGEGLRPGEPVAILAPNSPEWVVARLALAAAGALAVHVDDLSTEAEVATILDDSGARRVFTVAAHLPALDALAGRRDLDCIRLDEGADGEARSWRDLLADEARGLPAVDPGAPGMLLYTSGTTGTPKSFTLSEANVAANVRALVGLGIIGPDDRALLPLPLHHVYPLVVGVLTALTGGAAVVFPEGPAGPQIAEALHRARPTALIGVPRLYAGLMAALEARVAARGRVARGVFNAVLGAAVWARERAGLRPGRLVFRPMRRRVAPALWLMVSGGARLEPAMVRRLEGLGWTVLSGYGLAETASIFTANVPGAWRLGSEGRPLDGGEVRIAEPDAEGVGEIQLRGPSVFDGYRGPEGANREVFTADGWFRTGDLGRLDADGYVYVSGRTKEVIVLGGGKNVYPEDLEKAYGASPYIAEVAVLERGGKLVGLVRPDMDAIVAGGSTRVEDVLRVAITEISQGLPSFQRLAGFAVVRETLPRTRLGKFRRFLLPEIYERARAGAAPRRAAAPGPEDRALIERPPGREVWRWLAARFPDHELSLDSSPQLDLGIDSLDWLNMSIELQDRFGIRLDEERVASATTLRDLMRAVAESDAARAPPDPARWLAPRGPALAALGWLLWRLDRLLARLLFRLRVEGLERLPRHGPFVLTPNHVSDLDGFVVAAAVPAPLLGQLYWGGEVTRLFASRPARLLSRACQIFPVDERAPAATVATAGEVLARGRALTWFPEAWRSPTGELQRFLPGIGMLLAQSGAPAVPVHISGTFEAMPRGARLPRPARVTVRFGSPAAPDELLRAGKGDTDAERIADALRDRVAQLGGVAG